jgi:D-sedoheptulose 7-phosphate isomerase
VTAKEIAKVIIDTFDKGNKLLCVGNGGSAEMSSHLCAEFVNKYTQYTKPHPAIPLTDSAIITSIANDSGYEFIFSRQVEAFGKQGDLLIIFSTSGRSINCINASVKAQQRGLQVLQWPREGKDTGEIQNNQLALIHRVCEIVERYYLDDN